MVTPDSNSRRLIGENVHIPKLKVNEPTNVSLILVYFPVKHMAQHRWVTPDSNRSKYHIDLTQLEYFTNIGAI